MEWISFDIKRPKNNERCLVCYKPWERVLVLTYNSYYDCWDDDEDDYFCGYTDIDYWSPLPNYKNS